MHLSICIATFKRAAFIAETLESIVAQLDARVELVVVDGASPDDTAGQVRPFLARGHSVRYVREDVNSGVDADYDKAVSYARGTYCWLMTDDDLLQPGAVARVIAALAGAPDLVVVNAHVATADLASMLIDRCLPFQDDCEYRGGEESFFVECANYLSFIGGVVVKRELWLQRARAPYIGTAFIHVGVLFQQPIVGRIRVIAEPLIRIRYGNAMWTSRGFEIWMFNWPRLIWSFGAYTDSAKHRVCLREPWRSIKKLVLARAVGSYSIAEYRRWIGDQATGATAWRAWIIASMPGAAANLIAGTYGVFFNLAAKATTYDLARSRYSTWVSRLAARLSGIRWRGASAARVLESG